MENLTDQPDEDINIIMQNYKENKKIYKTSGNLTKYERTRILSERAIRVPKQAIDKYKKLPKLTNKEQKLRFYEKGLKDIDRLVLRIRAESNPDKVNSLVSDLKEKISLTNYYGHETYFCQGTSRYKRISATI